MIGRYVPEFLRHAPVPGVRGFAVLAGLEASLRGLLVSVWPLVIYEALGDAGAVSLLYFLAGLIALGYGLMVPWISRFIARRWVYSLGIGLYLAGPGLAIIGGPLATPAAMLLTGLGTVTIFITTNAYIMDYIARHELGRSETLRLFYSAVSWAIGPVAGVAMWKLWAPLPFLLAMVAAAGLGAVFWFLRLGNGRLITRARAPAPNPLAYLGRFFRQPMLIAGWLFAVLRSSGWWVYVVYLPIFCVEAGLGDQIASLAFSVSNALLLAAPVMLRWMQRRGLRRAMRQAFAAAAAAFLLAGLGAVWPVMAIAGLFLGAVFLVMLDSFGGLPFLMAVRPSERTEMSAVYSSYRDVSGILTPGVAWLVLLVAPLPAVFVACAGGLTVAWAIAGRLHPRLGARRSRSDQPA